jgi:hypothetical protein
VYDVVIPKVLVIDGNMLNSLLVAPSSVDVCEEIVKIVSLLTPVDECVNLDVPPVTCCVSNMGDDSITELVALLTLVVECSTDVLIVDVILFELFSKIAVEVLVSMLEIAFDDNSDRDEVSLELETLVIVVVSISLGNDEVECACDIYGSMDSDMYSLVVSMFGLMVLVI